MTSFLESIFVLYFCFLYFGFLYWYFFTKKPAFSSVMSGGAILIDFSKMAVSRDLERDERCAYTHFQAEIRGFRLIWVSSLNSC